MPGFSVVRAMITGAMLGVTVVAAGCTTASLNDLGVASSEISPQLAKEMATKGFRQEQPVLIRIFKKESELEVWKLTPSGRYAIFKTYPICRWSGKLGPKREAGDRQAPEGFYHVSAGMLNPTSEYYRSFNLGYPNRLEAALGYSGDALMVHGACSSSGCFAMTDQGVGEIYATVEKALASGQKRVQVQSYPFRMTRTNISAHRDDPNIAFWRNLKQGYDAFETTRRELKVSVCEKRYVFNRDFEKGEPREPLKTCSRMNVPVQDADTSASVALFDSADDTPLHAETYADGGMNRAYRILLQKYGAKTLSSRVSTTNYPISRPEAALADPFQK